MRTRRAALSCQLPPLRAEGSKKGCPTIDMRVRGGYDFMLEHKMPPRKYNLQVVNKTAGRLGILSKIWLNIIKKLLLYHQLSEMQN